ncbi:hypothetical protein [Candidatus Palauibacter sp.]|uniref:hypothetical protein n=1 Tax=Candidatus Palauibacter sp. TaxID=3101350 RepID=UPI003B5C615F
MYLLQERLDKAWFLGHYFVASLLPQKREIVLDGSRQRGGQAIQRISGVKRRHGDDRDMQLIGFDKRDQAFGAESG